MTFKDAMTIYKEIEKKIELIDHYEKIIGQTFLDQKTLMGDLDSIRTLFYRILGRYDNMDVINGAD